MVIRSLFTRLWVLLVAVQWLSEDVSGLLQLLPTSTRPVRSQRLVDYETSQTQRPVVELGRSKKPNDDVEENTLAKESVRFLGRGADAIVRPGCVLVAPSQEFHHFYRRSAIFIHAMGEDPTDNNLYVIRGLIIDHPTVFTLEEMMEHKPSITSNPLGKNFLFRGGDKGKDGVILLHNQKDLAQHEIGVSGIYEGGWQAALEACSSGSKETKNFKAFFNYCEFTEDELQDLLDQEEDGDAWISVEVSPDIILNPDWDRGDAWTRLRNTLKQMKVY